MKEEDKKLLSSALYILNLVNCKENVDNVNRLVELKSIITCLSSTLDTYISGKTIKSSILTDFYSNVLLQKTNNYPSTNGEPVFTLQQIINIIKASLNELSTYEYYRNRNLWPILEVLMVNFTYVHDKMTDENENKE